MTVTIIGGSGFVGSRLAKLLIEKGYNVDKPRNLAKSVTVE